MALLRVGLLGLLLLGGSLDIAQAKAAKDPNAGWVASWTASAHGPYPVGNPTAQPEQKFALPSAETGAFGSDVPHDRSPGCMGRTGAHPAVQRVRHKTGDIRRCLCSACKAAAPLWFQEPIER